MVDLNGPEMIHRAKTTDSTELEPMYWIVEDSLYKGDNDTAKVIFEELLYVAKYRPDLLSQGLKSRQRERLQEIAYELYDKSTYKKRDPIRVKLATSKRHIPFRKESHLRDFLATHPTILSDALNDNISITGTEVATEDGYKCDIVAESADKFYPIELKIVQGKHDLVSQCNKYCFYFYRQLRYSRYKDIQGVVIANGFDAYSINEIRRDGNWVYEIIPKDNNISLKKINPTS